MSRTRRRERTADGENAGHPDSPISRLISPPAEIQWQTFLDTPPREHRYEDARFVIIPVPYDGTASFRGGARYGPAAIIDASRHLEDYDMELGFDPSAEGIYTLPEIVPDMSGPRRLVERTREIAASIIRDAKIPITLGGDHAVGIGPALACAERWDDLSVLYIDAHADLRDSFMGTRWGHASAARRMSERCAAMVQVGVRSASEGELEFARSAGVAIHAWPPPLSDPIETVAERAADALTERVYVSIDLDALDPSIMSAVGTPEPDGMTWRETTALIRAIARRARVVGFDIVELSPEEGPVACSSAAAKLVYKMIGYIADGGR